MYARNATSTPSVTSLPLTINQPPYAITETVAAALHNSTTGSSIDDSVLAWMFAMRLSLFNSSKCSWLGASRANACTTRTPANDSANSPVRTATVMRDLLYATLAFSVKIHTAMTITGMTAKVTSASLGASAAITATVNTSVSTSLSAWMIPLLSNSFTVWTSLITRETTTPAG